ncbi:hypothetical protein ACHWQZ_G014013 [Mnemiopsis leidyi]
MGVMYDNDDRLQPVAMAVKKDKPLVTHLPHVKKVIDEAPPEYIIMIVVAFLQVFAMTISLVHIVNKHRAFIRNKPGMVGPTIGLLSFYWVIATLNLLGLFVLRANFLCQTICSCYDALIGYLFAVLLIAYANGKLSYLSILRWREVVASPYSCSLLCCWGTVAQPRAERAVTYILQLPVVHCATSLAELICENEELFIYPAPLTKSYITFGLKCAQGLSLFFAIIGFLVLCRAASIVSPRTSPFLKLILYKSIYILSAVQGHVLLYMAFHKILPAISDIAPVTRAIVWTNFATITECTFAYFLAIRLYKIREYTEIQSFKARNISKTLEKVESRDALYKSTFEGEKKKGDMGSGEVSEGGASASTPELELDKQDLMNLKLLGLKVKLPAEVDDTYSMSSFKGQLTLSSDDEQSHYKKGKLKKGAFRSVDTMLAATKKPAISPKSAHLIRGDKAATIDYAKVAIKEQEEEEDENIEPKIRIVGGKVNISLSSRDLAKLCKSSGNSDDARNSIPISLSLEKLTDDGEDDESVMTSEDREVPTLPREKNRVKFEDSDPKNRHSMQFVKSFSYTQLNSSDGESENEGLCELENSNSRTIVDPSQYVSKISLV